jgi:hypothetical protein
MEGPQVSAFATSGGRQRLQERSDEGAGSRRFAAAPSQARTLQRLPPASSATHPTLA